MVALGLVRIGDGKLRDRFVECFGFSQVAGNLSRVARTSVRAGEHPSAKFHILEPILFGHRFNVNFHAHVAELAKIEIMALVVACPTKEHIAGRLQHSLAGDDPLSLIRIAALAHIGREHRRLSLLALQ